MIHITKREPEDCHPPAPFCISVMPPLWHGTLLSGRTKPCTPRQVTLRAYSSFLRENLYPSRGIQRAHFIHSSYRSSGRCRFSKIRWATPATNAEGASSG